MLKLREDDIIAVANRRYMKRVGNKLLGFLAAAIVCGFGGAWFIGDTNPTVKWGLIVLVIIAVIFLAWAMDKGQKNERRKLLDEWRESEPSGEK